MSRVGILAGGGRLPILVAESVVKRGGGVHIVAVQGEADQAIAGFPHTWVNWAQVGRILATLQKEADEIVIAGGVRRPDLRKLRPDAGFFTNLPQLVGFLAGGDDSVLTRLVRFFEARGYVIRGAHEVAPELLARPGPFGRVVLSPESRRDAELGFAVRAALGPLDAGQAVAVANGCVLAIEGAEGTDAMLERIAALRQGTALTSLSGVLAKGPKPGQELRVDMPVIGQRTVELAAAAGLAGIAVEAGNVMVLGREEAVCAADAHELAMEGLAGGAPAVRGSVSITHPRGRVMGRVRPKRQSRDDVETGLAAVERLAPFDTGSAVVVARKYILALAAAEPLAAMLGRVGALRQWGMHGKHRVGALVCRADASADHVALSQMLDAAARQGLAGIAVTGPPAALGGYEALAPLADARGLFLVTCPDGDEG